VKPAPPIILSKDLFLALDAELLALLRALSDEDWNRPTVCSRWTVKDIAAHLLDGSLRRMSAQRDGYFPPEAPRDFDSYESLLGYLDQLNSSWTRAARRLSPRVLIELLETTGGPYAELMAGLDPLAPALFAVAWAGERESLNWMDVARDYSEKWHHQQQIAIAVDRSGPLLTRRLGHPAIDTFMRALPHGFRQVTAEEGTVVEVHARGAAGGHWFLTRREGRWSLELDVAQAPRSRVTFDEDSAWRVLTKRVDAETALALFPSIVLAGDPSLARAVLETVSIMA
jgi:uncharacterized protein (TIGR03083 family)